MLRPQPGGKASLLFVCLHNWPLSPLILYHSQRKSVQQAPECILVTELATSYYAYLQWPHAF